MISIFNNSFFFSVLFKLREVKTLTIYVVSTFLWLYLYLYLSRQHRIFFSYSHPPAVSHLKAKTEI